MLTQLLFQDVFGAAKLQEAGLAADCARLERGQGRDLPTRLLCPFPPLFVSPSEAAALPFPGVIFLRRLQPCSAWTWLLAVRKYPVHDSSDHSTLPPSQKPCEEQAVTSAVPQLPGRKVGKQPGIAAWKVLPVAGRHQGKERVLDLLSVHWEQLSASQPGIVQAALNADLSLVWFCPDGDNRKGFFLPEIPGPGAALEQCCPCCDTWHRSGTRQQEPLLPAGGSGVGIMGIPEAGKEKLMGLGLQLGWICSYPGGATAQVMRVGTWREGLFASHYPQISSLHINVRVGVCRGVL